MSDIESEEYEIMEVPVETKEQESPKVLPHSILCDYTIRDIVENPRESYEFSTSEYCDNIKEITGEVNSQECPGRTIFELHNKNWVSSAKMELTLTLNRDKLSKNTSDNVKDACDIMCDFKNISVETDDVDEENVDFRVITFTYSGDSSFTIETNLIYNWTLRTLNDSECCVKLFYNPDFFNIIKNLKNNELKSASKRRFNVALQKIYIDQLKKDGNYYCEELQSAKDRIHNLNIDLKTSKDQIRCLEDECENTYNRREALNQKNKSALQEMKDLRDKLNRMKFLKDFYSSETKIAKNKREYAEKQVETFKNKNTELENNNAELENNNAELENNNAELENENIELMNNITELENNITELENKNNTLKDEFYNIEDEYNDLEDDYSDLKSKYTKLKDAYCLLKDAEEYSQGEQGKQEQEEDKIQEMENKIQFLEAECDLCKSTIKDQKLIIDSISAAKNDTQVYKDLAKKYKAKLELKERDIENLEDIITEYKTELKKPIKYREDVKLLKADNKYLKDNLIKMKQEYNNLRNTQNHKSWADANEIVELRKEIAFLKGKRVNKSKIEDDIDEFHRRGYDMIDWYKQNRFNHTNEFVQFQKETEFLFNDVLNYFKKTLSIDKDKQLK